MTTALTLIGDGIENPHNVLALEEVARWFVAGCQFHASPARPQGISREEIACRFGPLIALDNYPGAPDLYSFSLPPGPAPALLVGSERRGISRALESLATHRVQIPMAAAGPRQAVNCLNVAAAAAVGLYYLCTGPAGRQPLHRHPASRRPSVLLSAPREHVEAGSALRSAAAFGWDRVWLDDRHGVWFGVDRQRNAEGRAAARRYRNPIHVLPAAKAVIGSFARIVVVTPCAEARPLRRVRLDGGPQDLIILPDRGSETMLPEALTSIPVEYARLEMPGLPSGTPVRYRLFATIVLAEIARQVGRPRPTRSSACLRYDRSLQLLPIEGRDCLYAEDLEPY